jgi:peptidoglycan/xylan/chitin deacetylase (PgdA/CDA1 family)
VTGRLTAGVAWTLEGFEVTVVDAGGTPQSPPVQVPAGRVAALVELLLALDRAAPHGLVCVVDSTNGMVDGALMAAGLRVHRADPQLLPPRDGAGSVPADVLARVGAEQSADLPRLVLEEGSLTGRSEDYERHLHESRSASAALTASGRCLVRGPEEAPVALTFDDGPWPPYTDRVLDVLERYGVPATFFCVGLHARGHPEQLVRMAESGHAIGNHTWSHPFLPDLTPEEFSAQLDRTDEAIARGGSPGPRLFRPPYGSRTPAVLDRFARRHPDSTMVLWDVDTGDWAMPGADVIAQRVLSGVRAGSIVLMHDGGGDRSQTAEALPAVVEGLLERGHRFTTVGGLLR